MSTNSTEQLLQQLNWRYATKRMNGEKVSQEKLNAILEATRLSASSYGLQPYTILVVENPELRAKLQPAAYNQPQTVEGSHILVYCAWNGVNQANIDAYMQDIADQRGLPIEALDGFKNYMAPVILGMDEASQRAWAAKQIYIALGTTLIAAAAAEVDSTPMEGFVPAQVDEILGLKEKGLHPVAMCVLGYRDAANDYLANAKKARRPSERLFQFL